MQTGVHLGVLLATLGAAWLMMVAGMAKKRVAWRDPGTCRRCGRPHENCSCR
jgi:hypothetical protein